MTLRHLLHLQKLWWGTGLLTCTSESLSWRWEFEIEAINLGLSCLTALHPPRVQGSVREQAGSYRCLSARSSPSTPSGSGGRYTWAVSREPLSAFKYPHQTTWTSDQILNGLQIMQRRRLFYWGGRRSVWLDCISRHRSLVKKLWLQYEEWVQKEVAKKLHNWPWHTL